MKRKEREHLKEDPFVNFVENDLVFLRKYKKLIYFGLFSLVALVVIIVLVNLLRSGAVSGENELYAQAIKIRESNTLTLDEKISQLETLQKKSGISSVSQLFIATIHFEDKNLEQARETMKNFRNSRYQLINDKKKLLEAEILFASQKGNEALKLLFELFSDKQTQVSKDYLLMRMAHMKIKLEQTKGAISDLNSLINDYPQSFHAGEARTLLDELNR